MKEELVIEIRVILSKTVRERREGMALSQRSFAKRMGSSQSRVAKIEASDPSVSLDLLVKALGATGATIDDIAEAIKSLAHAA